MSNGIRIGALALATNTRPATIRFYEQIGLLAPPSRTPGNYRSYGEDHIRRLIFIRRARDLGFSLGTVQVLLSLAEKPKQSCAQVVDLVAEQLHQIESKIADLQRLSTELMRLRNSCSDVQDYGCRIIEALYS